MITLSFSKAMVEGLDQELARAMGLNNLRLYKIVQGLLWIHEGKTLQRVAQLLHIFPDLRDQHGHPQHCQR